MFLPHFINKVSHLSHFLMWFPPPVPFLSLCGGGGGVKILVKIFKTCTCSIWDRANMVEVWSSWSRENKPALFDCCCLPTVIMCYQHIVYSMCPGWPDTPASQPAERVQLPCDLFHLGLLSVSHWVKAKLHDQQHSTTIPRILYVCTFCMFLLSAIHWSLKFPSAWLYIIKQIQSNP